MFARNLGRISPSIFTTVIPITSNVNGSIDFNAASIQQGWNGSKRLRTFATIASNVTVTSTSNAVPALNINLRENDFVRVINNGTIAGAPGDGGEGGLDSPGEDGRPGGDAIAAIPPTEIVNNGTIVPGGGGAGGDGGIRQPFSIFVGWAFSSCPQGGFAGGGGLCGVCAFTVRVQVGKGFQNQTRFVNANCYPVYSNGVNIIRGARGSLGVRFTPIRGGFGRTNNFTGGSGGPPGRPIRALRNIENIRIVNNGSIAEPQA
jgi:hypothetical protein